MNRGVILALALAVGAPVAVDAQVQQPSQSAQRRRDQIQLMEGLLARAVRLGAEQMSRRMISADPGMTLLTGSARARGFILEGYGVFFDVEIPALRKSVAWSMMTIGRDQQITTALDSLRRAIEAMPEGPSRAQAQQAYKQVQLQVGPLPQMQRTPAPPPGSVAAANTAEQVAAPAVDDPGTEYTESVKSALIDAMLEYSLPMDLGPDEWLTVAARDSEGPLTPNEIYDAMTIVLRVKGSDLTAYATDRSRRDEIRRRVEVRVF